MDLRHSPVVKKFPAPHGVAEVNAPVVSFVPRWPWQQRFHPQPLRCGLSPTEICISLLRLHPAPGLQWRHAVQRHPLQWSRFVHPAPWVWQYMAPEQLEGKQPDARTARRGPAFGRLSYLFFTIATMNSSARRCTSHSLRVSFTIASAQTCPQRSPTQQ